ncbi:hypothetical protein [Mucilaginibacter sp. FT3.2]|uniref:hypothetical protein n=1 Tax=Mucilaginibacter sp. FT3.2 TaxID=2723090 RepID=UPI00161DE9EF|nr:hypothetical protein [Mucilaginibacter sp. FT3.2]MBB6234437.1 hypothetical protein [Mucilaginibacter sp. FT3.2]
MKLLIDIADSKVESFIAMIKNHSYVKATTLSTPDAELFEEIKKIKSAFKNVEKIKAGKLKSRPAEDFLNEL